MIRIFSLKRQPIWVFSTSLKTPRTSRRLKEQLILFFISIPSRFSLRDSISSETNNFCLISADWMSINSSAPFDHLRILILMFSSFLKLDSKMIKYKTTHHQLHLFESWSSSTFSSSISQIFINNDFWFWREVFFLFFYFLRA